MINFSAIVHYEPESGTFTWKKALGPRSKIGAIAGTVNKSHGYRVLKIKGKQYMAAKVAYYIMEGKWTKVDHKNGIRDDDRWCNLREATAVQNSANMKSKNRELPRGVHITDNTIWATITHNKKKIYLGSFDTIDEAAKAYERKAIELNGEYAYGHSIR